MSDSITHADFEQLGDRFKAAIRAAGTSAKVLEPALGVSKGSFGKLYKGKYPLRQELLEAFAAEVGVAPEDLVKGTVFAVNFGYDQEAHTPAPTPAPAPGPTHPPTMPLDASRLSMGVPFEEQLTLTDELDDDDDVDLTSTQEGGWGRTDGPFGPVEDEGLLVDLPAPIEDVAPATPPAPAPPAPAAPAPTLTSQAPDATAAPGAASQEGEQGLLSSLTSRFKGLFS